MIQERDHSEAWSPETTVGGNSWEPRWYHIWEIDGVCGRDTKGIAGCCARCIWPRGKTFSLPRPRKTIVTTHFEIETTTILGESILEDPRQL